MKLKMLILLVTCHTLSAFESVGTDLIRHLSYQVTRRKCKRASAHLTDLIRISPLFTSNRSLPDIPQRILYAVKKFNGVPGFDETVTRALLDANGGHFYEITTALVLIRKTKRLIAFNEMKKLPSRKKHREIDLICEEHDESQLWIECKSRLPNHLRERIQEQILDQQQLAHSNHASFTLYTPHVSPKWQEWLSQNKIQYCESDSSDYEYDDDDSSTSS